MIEADEFFPTIAPGDGKTLLGTAGNSTAGVLLDHSTANTLKVRNPGNTADAPLTASQISVGGSAVTITAVNTVNPTSPNRTITITYGGTTYYLAAKTTND